MPRDIGPADLTDWPRVCTAIAAAEPLWRPGTETGYHSYTFGFLVGEIARRTTGKPMRQLLHDWIAAPLGRQQRDDVGVAQGFVLPAVAPVARRARRLDRERQDQGAAQAPEHEQQAHGPADALHGAHRSPAIRAGAPLGPCEQVLVE